MTIVKTSYRDHSAASLLAYIGRNEMLIKDRAGQELSLGEQAQFVEQSEDYGFERETIISPKRGEELSEREFEFRTRQTMREFTEDRPSARYVYAVHDDSDHVHAHVALTGHHDDLYMDRSDIPHVRGRATDRFRDAERAAQRSRDQDQDQERTQASELQLASEVDRDREHEREQGRDHGGRAASGRTR